MTAPTKVLQSGLSRHVHPINQTRSTQLNAPSKEQLALPFYHLLPKDPVELVRWKLYVRERCLNDLKFREAVDEVCRQDIAFWAATFGWVFEPRPPRGIPLCMWTDQVDCLVWMKECFDAERDLGFEKTRGLFMSWTAALFVYWVWKYVPDAKIAYITKDELTMDGPDENSFIGKVVYLHHKMPAWDRLGANGRDIMKRTMDQHILRNLRQGGTLQGFPPTDQNVRSLRFTVLINDEFAYYPRNAAQTMVTAVHTAPCRIFISTWFGGTGTSFGTIMRVEKSTMLRVQAYWWNNPERWKGAYITENGRLKIIDTSYEFPPDYPFVLDGLLRSAWVDFELSRPGQNMQIALEELYGLQAESGRKLIRPATLDVILATVIPPWDCGEIDYSGKVTQFRKKPDGRIKLFADVGDGKGGPFSAGCDLGFGSGASDSTLEVIDLTTARQVLEFADNTIDPVSFAQLVDAILDWLCGLKGDGHCYLDFENNGQQGTSFGGELIRLGRGNIRERRYNRKVPHTDRVTYLGSHNKDGGLSIILELERAVMSGELMICSADVWEELRQFDKDEEGQPVFRSAGGRGHGDKTQGLGLAWAYARDKIIGTPDAEQTREHAQDEIRRIVKCRKDWSFGWRLKRGA